MICFCFPALGGMSEKTRDLLEAARAAGHPVVRNAESPHDRARGMLAAMGLATGAKWLVWIDADQVARLDQALALVATGEKEHADMVSGLYVDRHLARRGQLALNVTFPFSGPVRIGASGETYPIVGCGFGFVATRASLFQRIDAPACEYGKAWFLPLVANGKHHGEDRSFCMRARHAGAVMKADTRVMVGHLGTHEYTLEEMVEADNRRAMQATRPSAQA
jgi:hypothetical protein